MTNCNRGNDTKRKLKKGIQVSKVLETTQCDKFGSASFSSKYQKSRFKKSSVRQTLSSRKGKHSS